MTNVPADFLAFLFGGFILYLVFDGIKNQNKTFQATKRKGNNGKRKRKD